MRIVLRRAAARQRMARTGRALTAVALGLALAPGPAPAVDGDAPAQVTRLALPFSDVWGVIQGFGEGTHRGYATWALDFVPAVPGGGRRLPRGTPLARFPCFGAPVLAPADGTVVRAAAGARDWPAHVKGRGDGNFVILQHAPQEFTEFRHLRAGSVRVAVGQRVQRGQPIGACGNSGNAGTPHVHMGFLSSIDPIATRPMTLSAYQLRNADGSWRMATDAAPLRQGDIVRPLAP
jgi:murein DD-endopeptidase MepM/ murein hydrolase activator NlpD